MVACSQDHGRRIKAVDACQLRESRNANEMRGSQGDAEISCVMRATAERQEIETRVTGADVCGDVVG